MRVWLLSYLRKKYWLDATVACLSQTFYKIDLYKIYKRERLFHVFESTINFYFASLTIQLIPYGLIQHTVKSQKLKVSTKYTYCPDCSFIPYLAQIYFTCRLNQWFKDA